MNNLTQASAPSEWLQGYLASESQDRVDIPLDFIERMGATLACFSAVLVKRAKESDLLTPESAIVKEACDWAGINPSRTARKYLKEAERHGVISRFKCSDDGAVEILKRKQPQKSEARFGSRCTWCQCDTAALHDHHHPVRASEGGTITVPICSNCHAEFHQMTDRIVYKLSQASESPSTTGTQS